MAKKPFSSELFNFAYFPTYEESICYLAEKLADAEDWDFSDSRERKYSILKNYLEHTFRKLKNEGKIAYTSDNSAACFNTGLVTKNLEEIFAYFKAYQNIHNRENAAPFVFKAFLRKSDFQFLTAFPGNLPDVADYFQRAEDLIFNPRFAIIPQIDHIIEENRMRFPEHMAQLPNDEVRRRLEGAIDEVKRKVKTNYMMAVPQYYDNKIQLLLPLCLRQVLPTRTLL
jgi:hypothetical protein